MTAFTSYQTRVENALTQWLPDEQSTPTTLHQAMHYAVLNGGKRLRPLLVYLTGEYFAASLDQLDVAASCVEMIHSYSLVHDDLPAMDDAALRRGKPSCHKAFDEATAILVGDALQAHTFYVLLDRGHQLNIADRNLLAMANELTFAISSYGMAGGQALDMNLAHIQQAEDCLEIHRLKTGALIKASVLMGAYTADIHDENTLQKLRDFADCLGLAFQIQDDILDITASTETLGKPSGIDATHDKKTYPQFVGLDVARQEVDALYSKSDAILKSITSDGDRGAFDDLLSFLKTRTF
jgi:geranylgeranyl pyrophosphate synthase